MLCPFKISLICGINSLYNLYAKMAAAKSKKTFKSQALKAKTDDVSDSDSSKAEPVVGGSKIE